HVYLAQPKAGAGAPAQDKTQDKTDFLRVKGWTGTFEVQLQGAESFVEYQIAYSAKVDLSAKGTLTFTETDTGKKIKGSAVRYYKRQQWVGGGEMHVRYKGHGETTSLDGSHSEVDAKAANRNGALAPDCYMLIHLDDDEYGRYKRHRNYSYTYSLHIWSGGGRWFTIDQKTNSAGLVEHDQLDGHLTFDLTQIPLPKTGLQLKGSRQIPAEIWAKSAYFPDDRFDFDGDTPSEMLGSIWFRKEQPPVPGNVTVSWDISPVIETGPRGLIDPRGYYEPGGPAQK
ncbi:MAG: hypothetical protein ACREXY_16545, partial [Gammaproteobacteria bacterium]